MFNMRAVRVVWLIATLVAGGNLTARAASPEANADQSAGHGFDVASAFTLRLQLPFTQRVLWQRSISGGYNLSNSGALTLLGGSLSRRFDDLVEAEAGAALVIDPCGVGSQATLRLGVSPSLSTPSPGGSHWNVRIPVLASAHVVSVSGDGCDDPKTSGRVFDMASGIDATWWSPAGTGFNLRLLAGYGFDGLTEATLAMGMAF